MPRATKQYLALFLLFSIAAMDRIGTTAEALKLLSSGGNESKLPATTKVMTPVFGSPPLFDHRLLAIDGKPFRAYRELLDAVHQRKTGDTIRLTMSRPSGEVLERDIPVGNQAGQYTGLTAIVQIVCVDILVPLIALLVGFGAAFIRPRDRHAWLLLFIMLSCVELLRRTDWVGTSSDAGVLWSSFWGISWGPWMCLFAISFPDRLEFDRKRPWLKWMLVGPLLAIGIAIGGLLVLWLHDLRAAEALRPLMIRLRLVQTIGTMVAIGIFFAALGYKGGIEKSPDGKRRLGILQFGTRLSMFPSFGLVLFALLRDRDLFDGVPVPIIIISIFMLCLLPLTLAYVIVVERAMDLSFVVRQSLKYALARGGLWVARATVIGIAIAIFRTVAPDDQGRGGYPLALVALAAVLLLLRRRFADRASEWVDRKFFREAYDLELVLGDLAAEAGRYVELNPLLERVALRLSDTLHVPEIVVLIRDGVEFVPRYSTHPMGPAGMPTDCRIVRELSTRREAIEIYHDKPPLWLLGVADSERLALDRMHSQLLIPLIGQRSRDLEGFVSLGPKLSELPYTATDIRLLHAVAAQMALAMENSRLIASLAAEAAERERANRELEIAREVQERLFPQRSPNIPGFDCAGYCRPARGVGGDYYDFLDLSDGRIGIAIGDVSGKGIAAALMMASLQASLRGQTMAEVHDLPVLMHNVNKLLYDASTSNRYATFFYGELDPVTLRMDFVNAGHNAPIILRGNDVVRLEAGGPVVGLLPRARFGGDSCQLEPGDIFIAFTDGISEAQDETEEEWEEDRFIAAVRSSQRQPARKMIEAIFAAADGFTGSAKQYDDMTLVIFKLAGTART